MLQGKEMKVWLFKKNKKPLCGSDKFLITGWKQIVYCLFFEGFLYLQNVSFSWFLSFLNPVLLSKDLLNSNPSETFFIVSVFSYYVRWSALYLLIFSIIPVYPPPLKSIVLLSIVLIITIITAGLFLSLMIHNSLLCNINCIQCVCT